MDFILKKNMTSDINKNGNESVHPSLGKMNCSRIQDPIELNHIYLVIEKGLDAIHSITCSQPQDFTCHWRGDSRGSAFHLDTLRFSIIITVSPLGCICICDQ